MPATELSFKVSNEEFDLIGQIADRAMDLQREHTHPRERRQRMTFVMDLCATVANGNPLRLSDLLAADEFNFIHDVWGIARHLNRETGKLEDHFSPRFSLRQASDA